MDPVDLSGPFQDSINPFSLEAVGSHPHVTAKYQEDANQFRGIAISRYNL